jgi:hypothetical protein
MVASAAPTKVAKAVKRIDTSLESFAPSSGWSSTGGEF